MYLLYLVQSAEFRAMAARLEPVNDRNAAAYQYYIDQALENLYLWDPSQVLYN